MRKKSLWFLFASLQAVYSLSVHPFPAQKIGALAIFPPSVRFVNTTVDHFTYDASQGSVEFSQKYLVYDTYHQADGPVLFFFGGEVGKLYCPPSEF